MDGLKKEKSANATFTALQSFSSSPVWRSIVQFRIHHGRLIEALNIHLYKVSLDLR